MIVQILPVSCSFSCDNVTCVFCKVRNCELLKRFRVSTRLLYVYMSSTGGATSLPDPDRYDGVLQIQEHCLDSLQPLRFTWETLRTVRGLASWSTPTTKSEKQTRRTFCSLNVWNLYYIYRYITYLQGWEDKKRDVFWIFLKVRPVNWLIGSKGHNKLAVQTLDLILMKCKLFYGIRLLG